MLRESLFMEQVADFAAQWLQHSVGCADIAPDEPDGVVNMLDFATLAGNWLEGL